MKHEKITDTLVVNMLQFHKYIDGNFNSIQPGVSVWAKKSDNEIINKLLSTASKQKTKEQGYPEFIIFDSKNNLVLVIEDKRDTKYHIYNDLEKNINKYAVNGAIWYASKLKIDFDVIAIGISGNTIDNLLIDTYAWKKGSDSFSNLNLHEILNINSYRDLVLKKERIVTSSNELKILNEKAKEINEFLRDYLGVMEHKRLYILGSILFALEDPVFKMTYSGFSNNKDLSIYLYQTIERKTKNTGLRHSDIVRIELTPCLDGLGGTEKEGAKNKYPKGTLLELIKNIDGILFEYYKNSEIDLISIFFNVFLSYSTKGGSDLGIVLTPSHITKLFSELANVNLKSKILDPCAGTGGFLASAWKKISLDDSISYTQKENFRTNNLFGVEKETSVYTIAALNMFLNKDGKSNLYFNDCFAIKNELRNLDCNVGFINPPYSDEVYSEIAFTELMLDCLLPNSIGIAILSVNASSSRTKKHNNLDNVKERILNKHTLKASIQMPNQLFYPKGTETVILVFETGKKHNSETWFSSFDDGYELIKHQKVRTPGANSEIKIQEFIKAYRESKETEFSFNKEISAKDQWVYTLHKTAKYNLFDNDFQNTINEYISYLFQNRYLLENKKHNKNNPGKLILTMVNLYEYFDIEQTNQTDKMNLKISAKEEIDAVPFLGRKNSNNGISDYVIKDKNSFNNGEVLTIALDGSTGATFYQHHGFCSGQNIWILKRKISKISKLSPIIALFLITSISKAVINYSYNLSLTKTRLQNIKLLLPLNKDGSLNIDIIEQKMSCFHNSGYLYNIPEKRY